MLSQKQKLHLTSGFALLLQVCTMVYGFILPRLFLEYFGSAINGLVSSISQFLGFIALAECGVGAVVQSALYKPLADKNDNDLSRIVVASEIFFRNIAKLLLLYTGVLSIVYPNIINGQFDYLYTASLILIIAISSFAQYYFGITYRLLLNSDQFGFVPIVVQIIALSLNFVASVCLMKLGAPVHVVKLVSSIVFLFQPLTISFIARRWHKIDKTVPFDKKAIKQKWNGFAQHVAAVVLQNCGISVLTIVSSLEKVSVYSLYFLVVCSLRNLLSSLTSGYQALLGNLFATGNNDKFYEVFLLFEKKIHVVYVLVFPVTAVLIVPFVGFYTKGINDANYVLPFFGVVFSFAWGLSCLQIPYRVLTFAVGHYKQTQNSSFVEVVINVTLSIVLAYRFDLMGIAIATFTALFYRYAYLSWYVSKRVFGKSMRHSLFLLLHDLVTILLFFAVVYFFFPGWIGYVPENFTDFMIYSVKIGLLSVLVVFSLNIRYAKVFLKTGV